MVEKNKPMSSLEMEFKLRSLVSKSHNLLNYPHEILLH